ncbi:tobH protein [Prescottella subtropica]|uniref:tobH protein n=1 Tax=Prescottella subtropica TaxID=2545757 RepID=UPI0010F5D163|nr:tobH protein [Prescottella subtropica]
MTAPSSLLDLDDTDALLAADVDGTLRFAALGGAQIRATHAAVEEGALARLRGLQPRSIVFVTGAGRAARAAGLFTATVGSRIGVPLVECPVTPRWVGPLDVVVVAGGDAGDPRLVESVDRALRRGAEVVVAAPDEGPLRAAGAGGAVPLPPRVAVPDQHGLLRYLTVFLAVLAALGSERTAAVCPDLGLLADAVDDESLRAHPRNEVFHNPAKALAARMQGRRVVLAGDGPATTELARHGSEILLRSGAAIAAATDLAEAVAGVPRFTASTVSDAAGYDPLFHDEQLDGPVPGLPVRVFVLATEATRLLTERRVAALPDVDVLVAVHEHVHPADIAASGPGPEPVTVSDPRGDIEQMAVLVGRLEMSAAYLRLIGGN